MYMRNRNPAWLDTAVHVYMEYSHGSVATVTVSRGPGVGAYASWSRAISGTQPYTRDDRLTGYPIGSS